MPITITYKLKKTKLKKAVQLANKLLASDDLLKIIKKRTKPFDESNPNDLKPSKIAEYIENSTLAVTLCEYTNPKPTVGGMFSPRNPKRIHANRKAVPIRSECGLARMLVHECIHALSYDIRGASFSHDNDHPRSEHGDTAPYWIQDKLKPLCPGVDDDDVIEVEIIEDLAELDSRDIKCE